MAVQIIKKVRRADGPGLVFLDLKPDKATVVLMKRGIQRSIRQGLVLSIVCLAVGLSDGAVQGAQRVVVQGVSAKGDAVSSDQTVAAPTEKTTRATKATEAQKAKASRRSSQVQDIPLDKRLTALDLKKGGHIFIRLFKQEKLLELWMRRGDKYVLARSYPICAYSGTLGPKLAEGDKQAPEGIYWIKPSQLYASRRYRLVMDLGYPNAFDHANGRTGSYLQLHGGCSSAGCYAMTNKVMQEIYDLADAAFKTGQKHIAVHSYPFRMTQANFIRHKKSQWYGFWINLKQVYDTFEQSRVPPEVRVCDKSYRVAALGDGGSALAKQSCRLVWGPGNVRAKGRAKAGPPLPRLKVRCNRRLPSCRKWIALHTKILMRKHAAKLRAAKLRGARRTAKAAKGKK